MYRITWGLVETIVSLTPHPVCWIQICLGCFFFQTLWMILMHTTVWEVLRILFQFTSEQNYEPPWTCLQRDAVTNVISENAQALITACNRSSREDLEMPLFIGPPALHSLSSSPYQYITTMNYKRNRKQAKDSFETVCLVLNSTLNVVKTW